MEQTDWANCWRLEGTRWLRIKTAPPCTGMPRIATEKGFAERVLALTSMPSYLTSTVGTIPQQETIYAHKL